MQREPLVASRIKKQTGREMSDALAMALIENGYSPARAAAALGVHSVTFWRLCRRYGVRVVQNAQVTISQPEKEV